MKKSEDLYEDKILNHKLISIIMPVYNAEKTVQDSIKSVLNQTYHTWELIIVDDGSIDSSGKICDQFQENDSRIKVFHIENHGVSAARNYGISCAKGELVCFIDSDDRLYSNALESIIEEIGNSDLLIFGYNVSPSNIKQGYDISKEYRSSEELAKDFGLLHKNQLINIVWNKCFRRKLIIKYKCLFPEDISMGEDLIFVLSYIKKCQRVFISDKSLYEYNIQTVGSLTKKIRLDSFEIQKRLKDITDQTFNYHKDVQQVTSYIFVNHIIQELKKIICYTEFVSTEKRKQIYIWVTDNYFYKSYLMIEKRLPYNRCLKFFIRNKISMGIYLNFEIIECCVTLKHFIRNVIRRSKRNG